MNILLIGSGGREHALAFALAKSPLCTRLFTAPGNPGTAAFGVSRHPASVKPPSIAARDTPGFAWLIGAWQTR